MKEKKGRNRRTTLSILLAIFIFLCTLVAFLLICSVTADFDTRVLPSYARVDISPILEKTRDSWTDEDIDTLRLQTGILARDALLKQTNEKLLAFQEALYFQGEVRHDWVAFTTPHDELYYPGTDDPVTAPMVDLEAGDILVTSTCHSFGWRNGHAALILDRGRILQSFSLGYPSDIRGVNTLSGAKWFQQAANFMVLRLKNADAETRKAIADAAEEQLNDIPYSLGVGLVMAKDQGTMPKATNCSHLVWQAYKNAGYDIDFDGGAIATTRDIANSPYLEVVQIYGFDPIKGW